MMSSNIVPVTDLSFRVYTNEEIEKISVLKITAEDSVNLYGHFVKNGLYDLRLGPMSTKSYEVCETCSQSYSKCPGHFGHIDIPLPMYNPCFYEMIQSILLKTCFFCWNMNITRVKGLLLIYQKRLLEQGYLIDALKAEEIANSVTLLTDEAREVMGDIEQAEENEKPQFVEVASRLAKFLKMTKKTQEKCDSTTVHMQAIHDYFMKNYDYLTKRITTSTCPHCKMPFVKIKFENSQLHIKNLPSLLKAEGTSELNNNVSQCIIDIKQSFITAEQARDMLRKCWTSNHTLLGELYPMLKKFKTKYPTDVFFITKLLVMPPKFRPIMFRDGLIIEHEMTLLYKNVVKLAKCMNFLILVENQPINDEESELFKLIAQLLPGDLSADMKLAEFWQHIQSTINNILDSDMVVGRAKSCDKGILQILEKKEGVVRQNLMGKRVNFSARSVAAPDPYLCVDEIGIPQYFAERLTYPVPVTHLNVEFLRKLVINGDDVYPGASTLAYEDGRQIRLSNLSRKVRIAHANKLLTPSSSNGKKVNDSKIVYRHLQDGDYVLMNRQPSLHRPSIQAHKVKVMENDLVIRMPYANCKAYNADFDGDELNMHFPQNDMARAEAQYIVTTHNQYLTAKDGSPLSGLIQDCVVASVMLTVRGKFFNKEDYQQLVYVALSDMKGSLKILPPAIIKPYPLWSGKQIFSTILHNLIPAGKVKPTFKFKTTVKVEMWQNNSKRNWKAGGTPEKQKLSMTESELIMRDGELLCGVIDKCAIGSTSHGLIHICYELYGGRVSSNLLTAINRLCVTFLQWSGHTIGIKEFITPKKVSEDRRSTLKNMMSDCPSDVANVLSIENLPLYMELKHCSGDDKGLKLIDAAYNSVLKNPTGSATSANEKGLHRRYLDNHMRMMVDTGAKGSKVNMNQMASLFGSIALDGRRMPLTVVGKTLPVFKPYDTNPCSGGYIPTRFLTGMDPSSYFFLSICGRDSLQHTAVKTANSGYMQRCLIKHLEGIHVAYDHTVRNSDGVVLQFEYGEDGQDVLKMPFLKSDHSLDVLMDNYSKLLDKKSIELALSRGEPEKVAKYKKKVKKSLGKRNKMKRTSAFLKFCESKEHCYQYLTVYNVNNGRSLRSLQLQKDWIQLSSEERAKFDKYNIKTVDPVTSVFSGISNISAVSEALDDFIENYYENHYSKRSKCFINLTKEEVKQTVYMKALESKVDPGEAVGALCAQALGEPLTQMTLNTFHFAGKDELNVTLGVPRMIEILRTASEKISTPIMSVPFLPHVTKRQAKNLKKLLSPVSFSEVVSNITVHLFLKKRSDRRLYKEARMTFHFNSEKSYKKSLSITRKNVIDFVENTFIGVVAKVITKNIENDEENSLRTAFKNVSAKMENVGTAPDDMEDGTPDGKGRTQFNSDDESEDEARNADIQMCARKEKGEEYSDCEVDVNGDDVNSDDDDDDDLGNDESNSKDGQGKSIQSFIKNVKKRRSGGAKRGGTELPTDPTTIRFDAVIAQNEIIMEYSCDTEEFSWCEVIMSLPMAEGRYDLAEVLRKTVGESYIRRSRHLKKICIKESEDKTQQILSTEGVDFPKVFQFEHLLDINKLYTNNTMLIAKVYGIEAAQRSVINEIRAVQDVYDIQIDFRHLSLLSDYFMSEGRYKACSRHAIKTCSSPLQAMTYETFFHFMKRALIFDRKDTMASPSSNILVGNLVKIGTCCIDILTKTSL